MNVTNLIAWLALPLGGIGLAASSYFAAQFVGETFTRRDKFGTALISALQFVSCSCVLFVEC